MARPAVAAREAAPRAVAAAVQARRNSGQPSSGQRRSPRGTPVPVAGHRFCLHSSSARVYSSPQQSSSAGAAARPLRAAPSMVRPRIQAQMGSPLPPTKGLRGMPSAPPVDSPERLATKPPTSTPPRDLPERVVVGGAAAESAQKAVPKKRPPVLPERPAVVVVTKPPEEKQQEPPDLWVVAKHGGTGGGWTDRIRLPRRFPGLYDGVAAGICTRGWPDPGGHLGGRFPDRSRLGKDRAPPTSGPGELGDPGTTHLARCLCRARCALERRGVAMASRLVPARSPSKSGRSRPRSGWLWRNRVSSTRTRSRRS